jgi:hypothetical protein
MNPGVVAKARGKTSRRSRRSQRPQAEIWLTTISFCIFGLVLLTDKTTAVIRRSHRGRGIGEKQEAGAGLRRF